MSDTLAWAIFAAGAGVLVLLLLLLLVRERRAADDRFAAAMQQVTSRMDEMARELHAALDRTDEDDQRARILGELAGTIDLDEVLARVLEAAGAMRGVDAALVSLTRGAGEKPVVATVGLSAEEAEVQSLARPPEDGRGARSMTISCEYSPAGGSRGAEMIHHGVAVPIAGETSAIGSLTIFSRSAGHAFTDADRRSLEDLATRAGPAIENASRFREARQQADLDALTGLHNRRYFHETLGREVARAQRYGRRLALVVFDLDDFKAINDRIGHLAGDGVLAEVAERVRSVVRSADVACRVGGDEFGIILPESTLDDAEQLSHRIQAAVASRPIGEAGTLQLSAGAVELAAEDDTTKFFERADGALYRAKESGKAEVVAAGPTDRLRAETARVAGRAIGPLG
jgi:two-component system, cell cycle response regulator